MILTSGTVLFNTALSGLRLDAQTPGFGQKLLKHPQREKTSRDIDVLETKGIASKYYRLLCWFHVAVSKFVV